MKLGAFDYLQKPVGNFAEHLKQWPRRRKPPSERRWTRPSGHRRKAAGLPGIGERTLYEKLKQYGMRNP